MDINIDSVIRMCLIVSIPIYFLVLLAVRSGRAGLSDSFYVFFVSAGIADAGGLLLNMSWVIIPNWLFYEQWPKTKLFAMISKFIVWVVWYPQLLGVVNICIDRCTAMIWPMKYAKIWTPEKITATVVIQWGAGILTILPLFHPACTSHYHPNRSSLHSIFDDPNVTMAYYYADIVICGIILVTIVGLYGVIIVKLCFGSRNQTDASANAREAKKRKFAMKLTMMGLSLAINYVILLTATWTIYLSMMGAIEPLSERAFMFFWNLYNVSMGAFNVQSAYVMLLVSKNVRVAFVKIISCGSVNASILGGTTQSVTSVKEHGRSTVRKTPNNK